MIRLALAGFILMWSGVAQARGPYWVKTSQPVAYVVAEVADTTAYCGPNTAGCFHRGIGVVYLKSGMPAAKRACVLGHEATSPRSHANGWDHPEFNEPGFAFDCGDGTLWLPPVSG